MELAEPLRPVLALLQRAYPDGLPRQDYFPLLVVLGDLLSERNLAQVVAEFTGGETVVVDNDAAAAHSIRPPARSDVTGSGPSWTPTAWPISTTKKVADA